MADIGSTGNYVVILTMSTDSGDLPESDIMARLIHDQMEGTLSDEGLQCVAVDILGEAFA